MADNEQFKSLNADEIERSVERVYFDIDEYFPTSSLCGVCVQLLEIAHHAKERSAWVSKPIISLRISTWTLVAIIISGLAATIMTLPMPSKNVPVTEFIQVLEAGINDVVLIGAALFFLFTLESRIKRGRALRAIHELRSMAHIIDMHQLTKDPQRMNEALVFPGTPRPEYTAAELSRYLDYCSEMLSLTGKIAALYVQKFDDPVALASVNEVESLTTGLSRKIWQKLIILNSSQQRQQAAPTSPLTT